MPDKPSIDLVIFDCDGVLIDSEPLASATIATMLTKAGVPMSAEEAHVKFTGNALSTIRTMCIEDYGIANIDQHFAQWSELLFEEFARSLRPIPGIEAFVASVRVPKCVASNSPVTRLKKSLGLLPLWQEFAPHVYSAEMVARPKPAPDLLLHAAAQFNARPGHTIMIDDSPHGVESAIAAGMQAIGFVDLNDPRPYRREVLLEAGAHGVASGADELFQFI